MSFLDRLLRGSPPATGEEADRITLRKLQGIGADLTRPRHVLHFLEAPSSASARGAAEELEAAGYEVTITHPEGLEQAWSVRAESTRIIDATTVPAFRAWFEALAARHEAVYDGWEVSPRP
jgi:Regulator of ribonuclease activity B